MRSQREKEFFLCCVLIRFRLVLIFSCTESDTTESCSSAADMTDSTSREGSSCDDAMYTPSGTCLSDAFSGGSIGTASLGHDYLDGHEYGFDEKPHICPVCSLVSENLQEHLLWNCEKLPNPPSVTESPTPPCLRIHGIVPRGFVGPIVDQLHLLRRLEGLDRSRQAPATTAHPWIRYDRPHASESFMSTAKPVIEALTADKNMKWKEKNLHAQVVRWIQRLKWYDSGEVSCVELVIDFESSTGFMVCENENASIAERARKLRSKIAKLNRICKKIGKEEIFPGRSDLKVHSLRSVGGPAVLGYKSRPKFANHKTTSAILEDQITKAAPKTAGWGTDVCPNYNLNMEPSSKRTKSDPSSEVIT